MAASAAELDHLRGLVDAARFWSLLRHEPLDLGADPMDEDGSCWVFEGYLDGRLQVLDRLAPEDPALVSLGPQMLQLAGFQPDPRTVYGTGRPMRRPPERDRRAR